MPATATTTQPSPEAARAAAAAAVERLSKARLNVLREGSELDPAKLAAAEADLVKAGQRLGAADLLVKRQGDKPAFDLQKFQRQRTKAHDRHQALLNRLSEHSAAVADRTGLRNEIEEFERSDEFAALKHNLQRVGLDIQMSPDAEKFNRQHALLIQQMASAEVNVTQAAAALASAREAWQSAKSVVDAWERAIRNLPAGARLLEQIPAPHARADLDGTAVATPAAISVGPNAVPDASAIMRPESNPAAAPSTRVAASGPGLRTSAGAWGKANARTNAQHGLGPRADAFTPVPLSTGKLISTINEPGHLGALAERAGSLTEEQRDAALRAFSPPKEPRVKAPKAKKAKAKPVTKAAVKPKRAETPAEAIAAGKRSLRGITLRRLGFGGRA